MCSFVLILWHFFDYFFGGTMQHTQLIQKAREISNRHLYKTTPADNEACIAIFVDADHVHSQKDHPVCFNHLDEDFVKTLEDGKHLAFILSQSSGQ
jgi:hypothetical protein